MICSNSCHCQIVQVDAGYVDVFLQFHRVMVGVGWGAVVPLLYLVECQLVDRASDPAAGA